MGPFSSLSEIDTWISRCLINKNINITCENLYFIWFFQIQSENRPMMSIIIAIYSVFCSKYLTKSETRSNSSSSSSCGAAILDTSRHTKLFFNRKQNFSILDLWWDVNFNLAFLNHLHFELYFWRKETNVESVAMRKMTTKITY